MIKYLDKVSQMNKSLYVVDYRTFNNLESAINNAINTDQPAIYIHIINPIESNIEIPKEFFNGTYSVEQAIQLIPNYFKDRIIAVDQYKSKVLFEVMYNERYGISIKVDYGMLYGNIYLEEGEAYTSKSGFSLSSSNILFPEYNLIVGHYHDIKDLEYPMKDAKNIRYYGSDIDFCYNFYSPDNDTTSMPALFPVEDMEKVEEG